MKKILILCAFALGSGIGLSSVAMADNTRCETGCFTNYNHCIANGNPQASCQFWLQVCIGDCYPGCNNQVC